MLDSPRAPSPRSQEVTSCGNLGHKPAGVASAGQSPPLPPSLRSCSLALAGLSSVLLDGGSGELPDPAPPHSGRSGVSCPRDLHPVSAVWKGRSTSCKHHSSRASWFHSWAHGKALVCPVSHPFALPASPSPPRERHQDGAIALRAITLPPPAYATILNKPHYLKTREGKTDEGG